MQEHIVDIVLAAIVVLMTVRYYCQGLVQTIFKFGSFIVAGYLGEAARYKKSKQVSGRSSRLRLRTDGNYCIKRGLANILPCGV